MNSVTRVSVAKSQSHVWRCLFALMALSVLTTAQTYAAPSTIELFSVGGTTANGPVNAPQTFSYSLNTNNPTDNVATTYAAGIRTEYTISSTYSNRAYSDGGAQTNPDFMFGGTAKEGAQFVAPALIYGPINGIGFGAGGNTPPPDQFFASTPRNASGACSNMTACTTTAGGISGTANYGAGLFIATNTLQAQGAATNGVQHQMGQITIRFKDASGNPVAVTNPVLTVVGLGGTTPVTSGTALGYSPEFKLVSDVSLNGVTLERIAGSKELSVSGTDITNNASTIASTTNSGGASGSISLTGRRITEVTFNVYLRGDGKGTNWSVGNNLNGDRFYFTVSSLEADVDLAIDKKQRVGTSGTFVANQISLRPTETIQYQLMINTTTPRDGFTPATYVDIVPPELENAQIISTTPAGGATCPAASLSGATVSGTFTGPANSSCTVVVQARVKSDVAANTIITNTGVVLEAETDLNTVNNTSSVNAQVLPFATITLNKALAGNRISDTDQFALQILNGATVVNSTTNSTTTGTGSTVTAGTGTTGATNVVPTINYSLTEAIAGTTTLSQYSRNVTCTGSPSDTNANDGLTLTNADLGKNIVCTLTNTPNIDLSVVKSQRAGTTGSFQTTPLSVLILGNLQYQLVLSNNGPAAVSGATFSDAVPSQFTAVNVASATPSGGATACIASATGNTISGTWSGPSGATCTVIINATASLSTGTYTNTANLTAPANVVDTNSNNNSSAVQTTIDPAPSLPMTPIVATPSVCSIPSADRVALVNWPAGTGFAENTAYPFNNTIAGYSNSVRYSKLSGTFVSGTPKNYTISYPLSAAAGPLNNLSIEYMEYLLTNVSGVDGQVRYDLTNPISSADGVLIQDIDVNEDITINFFDASGAQLSTTNWTGTEVKAVPSSAVVTNSGTSIRMNGTGLGNQADSTWLFIPPANQQVSRMVITQNTGGGGTYVVSFVHSACDTDHGDAPATYGDAEHNQLSNTLRLGAIAPDKEPTALFSNNALGDNNNATNDEDGVTVTNLTAGGTATVSAVVAGLNGRLQGWIDWNGDGDFLDVGEQIISNIQDNQVGDTNLAVGTIAVAVAVPVNAVTTPTFARFRWSTDTNLTPVGLASNGEVEDYSVTVVAVPTYSLSGTVFEDINYGGGSGRSLAASSGVVRSNARVELYNAAGNFVSTTTTDAAGLYTFSGLVAGNYSVRVVNSSVTSSRTGLWPVYGRCKLSAPMPAQALRWPM